MNIYDQFGIAWLLALVVVTILSMFVICYHEVMEGIEEKRRAVQARSATLRVLAALKALGCEVWCPTLEECEVRYAFGLFHGQPFDAMRGPNGWHVCNDVTIGKFIDPDGFVCSRVRHEPGDPCDPELSRFLNAWCDFSSDTGEAGHEY